MNTDTGYLVPDYQSIPAEMKDKFIPVSRDLTMREMLNKHINIYSPCACGSGKKFKFCCKTTPTPP